MHEFKLEQGNVSYKIDINNFKFVVGNNFIKKYQIFSLFKNYFSKINNSEFAVEERNKRYCYFDENQIDLKLWKYFEISPYFDLDTDLKMGTKSLLNKYLESFSEEFEYNDYFSTLSTLISSLNEDYFEPETSIEFGDKTLNLRLSDITRNILFKEVVPFIKSNNNDCNSADLTYEELILLQLSLIEKIISKTSDRYFFINANIPLITPKILNKILGLKYDNCFSIINTNSLPNLNYQNIYLCGSYVIDFANDENIIENIMEFPFHIEKDAFLSGVQDYLSTQKITNENKNIVELFTK